MTTITIRWKIMAVKTALPAGNKARIYSFSKGPWVILGSC